MINRDDAAIAIMAAHILRESLESTVPLSEAWSEYPDIGENDWLRIVSGAEQLAGNIVHFVGGSRDDAYEQLAARANKETDCGLLDG